jgi:Tol biopolymer transport system component
VASGALERLTSGPATDANPAVSPDGLRVAYQSDEGGHLEVWVVKADGSGARPLTRTGVGGHFLRWSADGRSVVFTAAGGSGHVMQVAADGGDAAPLVDVAGGSHLSFSPDHTRIVDVVGHKTLWLTSVPGGRRELYAFADPADRIDYPTLSPDGRFILFDLFRPSGGDIWALESR